MGSSTVEVERLLRAARLHLAQGDLEEAVGRSTEAIRLEGKDADAYLVRAEAHRRLKKAERALADLAVAIRLDSNQPGPYVIRAEILKRRNMFDQSIADATHALTLDPRNAAAYSIRAECRSAIGDREGATEDIHEMLVIDPTRPLPDLRARSESGDESSGIAADGERFWKQSGGNATDGDRSALADGTPVDKTYRSRRVVGDEDAPEVLGVDSGYKPETIGTPIPRLRGKDRKSTGNGGGVALLVLGLAVVAVCAPWLAFRTTNEASTRPGTRQTSQVAPADTQAATPVAALAPSVEKNKPPANTALGSKTRTDLPGLPSPKLNLLPSLDPTNVSAGGRWESIEGGLVSPDGGSVLKIPYQPPDQYRLTLRLFKGSKQMVGIGLVTDPSQVLITLDTHPDGGCLSKFDVDAVERRGIVFHEGSRVLPMFQMSTVVCTVRKGSITVEVNGKRIGRWDGDFGRLAVHPEWAYGGKGLFIASVGKGTVIRGLEIEPLAQETNAAGTSSTGVAVPAIGDGTPIPLTTEPTTMVGGRSDGVRSIVRDLGSFSLAKGGRTWNVEMPEHFSKAEVIFYRGDPSDLTLNAAWEGHLRINAKDVVRFRTVIKPDTFIFFDYTTQAEYREKNDYKKIKPGRYLDVTTYLHPGENSFYYYHEQRPELPMGLILRLTVENDAQPK